MTSPEPESSGGNFFTRKYGPLPMWGWIAIAVGGLYVYQTFIAQKSKPASDQTATPNNMTSPNIFQIPAGIYSYPPAPNVTGTTPPATNNPYPGTPRPTDSVAHQALKDETSWQVIVDRYFSHSGSPETNAAALQQWDKTHGGTGNLTPGATIYLPKGSANNANGLESPGFL